VTDLVTVSRRLVRESSVMLVCDDGELQENYLFLFNDLLLVTRKKKKGFELKYRVEIVEARIVDVADTEAIKNAFEIHYEKNHSTFCTTSKEQKIAWLKDLKAMKKEYQKKQFKKANEEGTKVECI